MNLMILLDMLMREYIFLFVFINLELLEDVFYFRLVIFMIY